MILSRKVGDTLRDGLVLDLSLNEIDSDTFMSKDVYGHLCTNHESDWNMQGHSFNGTSNYIDCGNNESLKITDAITISCWIKRNGNSSSTDGIIDKNANTDGYLLRISDNVIKFFFRSPLASPTHKMIVANSILLNETWTHCIAVRDNNYDMWLYINGVKQTDITNFPYSLNPSANNMNIGMYVTGFFKGSLADVRVYNRALSENEIELLYNQTKEKYI